jgi:N-acyl-D-aspartate/D-glutamate deacylase
MRDESIRAALIEGGDGRSGIEGMREFFVLTPDGGARYDCDGADSLAAYAERSGVSAVEAYVDLCVATDGKVILNWPILNQDFSTIAAMLLDPRVMLGLADSGAHVGQILDASQPTFFLSYWIRERGLMSIGKGIHQLTGRPADLFGITDRGVLREGAKADVNVFSLDALALPLPTFEHDFPAGAGRFVQRSKGYDWTLVNGEVFMENGEHTGVLAGRPLLTS